MSERFLISKKNTGLGSDLATLVGAWHYANRTSRTLVIDWRNSVYLEDRTLNAFPRLFRELSEWNGVPVICDDSLRRRKFPEPVAFLHRLKRPEYDQLLNACGDVPAATVLNRRPMHIFPPATVQFRVLSMLRLHDDIEQEIREFRAREFCDATVLGVHLRHGNGEHLGVRNGALQDSCQRIAQACRLAFESMRGFGRRGFRVFLTTDSREIEQHLQLLLKSVFTRPKRFQLSGAGRLHRRQFGLESARDALIEMHLLAHCNTLLYSPSWFSYYARVAGNFDIPAVNLYPDAEYGLL